MKIKDFIQQKLNEILERIPGISYRYAYEENIDSHVLELTPFDLLKSKNEYMELICKIDSEFYDLYPDIDVVFTEQDDFYEMSPIIYEKKGQETSYAMKLPVLFDLSNQDLLPAGCNTASATKSTHYTDSFLECSGLENQEFTDFYGEYGMAA